MSIKQQIDQDLKTAMLAGEKVTATTLRGVKGAILNVEIAGGKRDLGLTDPEVIEVLSKEAKKRQESADLYMQGGSQEKADAELTEKKLIEKYLPEQMSEEELIAIVEQVISDTGANGMQAMGQVIGAVKQRVGVAADGGRIAKLVKEKLS